MKDFMKTAIFAIFVVACSNEKEINNPVNNNAMVPVRVHVDGFNVAQEDFPLTRAAQNVANYNGVNAVTLAFYNGSDEVYKVTQLKADNSNYTTFGNFSLSLPLGNFTMVVTAYQTKDSSPFVLTSPTEAAYTGDHSFDTFVKTQAVNITNTNAVDISTTLDRIVSCLNVISTDGKTAGVTNVRMTLSAGGKSFNPTTGLATSNTGFANTVGNNVSVGETSSSISYLFLATNEQTMNVTIETLNADGAVLFSKTVNNVSFKRNRVTKLTGAMYTNQGVSGAFQVETGWLTENDVEF